MLKSAILAASLAIGAAAPLGPAAEAAPLAAVAPALQSTPFASDIELVRHGYGKRRPHYRLSRREVHRSLRWRGFHRIRVRNARWPHYRARAFDRRGRMVRLKVHGFNGRILSYRVIRWRYRPVYH